MSLLGKVIVDSKPAMPCQIEEKNEKSSFFMSPAEVELGWQGYYTVTTEYYVELRRIEEGNTEWDTTTSISRYLDSVTTMPNALPS